MHVSRTLHFIFRCIHVVKSATGIRTHTLRYTMSVVCNEMVCIVRELGDYIARDSIMTKPQT